MDFFIPDEGKAIQVCFRLGEDETTKREVQALEKLDKAFDLQELIIVSRDTEDVIPLRNGKSIQVIPVWKWLL